MNTEHDSGNDAESTSTDQLSQLNLGSSNDEMQDPDDYLQPVALLIDQLRSDETSIRVEAIRRLPTIALALGQERTRMELVPFLMSSLDDEDEVLMTLGEELGKFVEFVGGPKYGHLLVGPLEGLASADETVVRQKVFKLMTMHLYINSCCIRLLIHWKYCVRCCLPTNLLLILYRQLKGWLQATGLPKRLRLSLCLRALLDVYPLLKRQNH